MKPIIHALTIFAVVGTAPALAQSNLLQGNKVPTADLKACVQADAKNDCKTNQKSDINILSTMQVGQENNLEAQQQGQNNNANVMQMQSPLPPK